MVILCGQCRMMDTTLSRCSMADMVHNQCRTVDITHRRCSMAGIVHNQCQIMVMIHSRYRVVKIRSLNPDNRCKA